MEGLTPTQFPLPAYAEEATRMKVIETLSKMHKYFGNHEKIMISVSGGSDSDCIVHLVCKYFPEHLQKCLFVFANTGLEFKATKEHLVYLEKKYGITINRIRGVSVVTSCKQNGVPIDNYRRNRKGVIK